jgi:hypothetical protein
MVYGNDHPVDRVDEYPKNPFVRILGSESVIWKELKKASISSAMQVFSSIGRLRAVPFSSSIIMRPSLTLKEANGITQIKEYESSLV